MVALLNLPVSVFYILYYNFLDQLTLQDGLEPL